MTIERPIDQIEEEILSDGSKVYNLIIQARTIYCKNELCAINLAQAIQEAIQQAQS